MPSLLRVNSADSRVVEDVDALVAAYDDDAVEASLASLREARADDLDFLSATYAEAAPPAAESPSQRVLVALNRYRLYVAAAVVFLAIILFMSPVPLPLAEGADGDTVTIPTADGQRVEVPSTDAAPFVDTTVFEFPAPAFADLGPSLANPSPDEPIVVPATPSALRITASGYASSLAGTPAEQEPPQNGLPAEAIAGAVTKYSFVRLSGTARTLKLKLVTEDGASMNAAEGRVQLCEITTAWKPARAERDTAPTYTDKCIGGAKSASGVWSFTFSDIYNPVASNGWAIVPVTTDSGTFRLTFSPTAAA